MNADNTANIEVADPDEAPWDYERMTAAGVLNREDALEFGKAAYLKAYEDVKDHVTNSIANSSAAFHSHRQGRAPRAERGERRDG